MYILVNLINYYQIKSNTKIIELIKHNDNIVNYYIGYIEIENKIKVPLVYGTTDKELDQNVVGVSNYSDNNHLILAGHAINSVFLPLYNVNIGDKIIVFINNKYNIYYIDKKYIVRENDTSVYNNNDLTLITCIEKNKRLIIHAKTA